MRRWMWSGALLGLFGLTSTAWAGDFDERGKLDTTGSALTVDFDAVPDEATTGSVVTFQGTSIDDSFIELDDTGLEGAGAMSIGGQRSGVVLSPGQSWDVFEGRRVEVSIWYKPQGTSLYAYMGWISGDGMSYFQGARTPVMMMGSINFHPTGRSTTDGWVELSSGPFDYLMGGLKPDWLLLRDTQELLTSQQGQGAVTDASVRVLVDALEVRDLGPSLVPDVSCHGANEDAMCGAGVCLVGRCVDAAAGLGQAPSGSIGDEYIARRLFEIETYSGPRAGRAMIPEVRTRLEGLDPTDPKAYWSGFSQAHELLIDGHGSPPSDASAAFYHPSGVCFGPGIANLSSDPARRTQMLPMVFSSNARFDVGAQLERGDVLVEIDGLDPWNWISRHPQYFYYNGDPAGREAISTLYIMQAAKKLGSTLTFERCSRVDGQPCDAMDAVEVQIDLGATLGEALWGQNPPSDLYDYTNECDMRFEREVSVPVNAAAYYFAGWKEVGDIRHLLINGVPSSYDNQGSNWHNTVNSALTTGPSKIVLDQRTGYGGTMEGVARIIGHLLDPANRTTSVFVPWVGEEIQGALFDTFFDCAVWSGGQGQACGNFFFQTITDIVNTGGSRTSRVAVLNGFDVSGNDYLSRFLAYRDAPTRIFGYGPAIGAYGVSCSFAGLLWERQPMRYQCHDSVFSATANGPFEGYESGTGVAPDEVVYQLQSDAIQGEDTMIKAAHQWLSAADEVMP